MTPDGNRDSALRGFLGWLSASGTTDPVERGGLIRSRTARLVLPLMLLAGVVYLIQQLIS